MNRAYLVILIPALGVSFYWTAFGYGVRAAIGALIVELGAVGAAVYWLKRRGSAAAGRS